MAEKVFIVALGMIVPLLFFEALIFTILHYPAFGNWRSLTFVQLIYDNDYRNIIQFEPAFAQYDPELMYTLKPGTFHFQNPEFKVVYRVNRLGLRDSDESLIKPDAIVLGDSNAMGWGVRQEETYAKILEEKSRLKVLNAAVSSYGTAREMRLLDRLDTSNTKFLIIHYMQNDDIENHFFSKNRYALRTGGQRVYEDMVQLYQKQKTYYPGKYIRLTFQYGLGASTNHSAGPGKTAPITELHDRREKLFLNAVMQASHVDLTRMKIIVLNTEADDPTFSKRLQAEIGNGDYPPYIKRMTVLPLAPKLDRQCFFALDEHIRAKGHAMIADEILKSLKTNR